ncbi:helix-turn-helix domain-containing protein [Microbacterium sp. Leaf151]|uniref:helix-turn-helix domain-containing protein n=1 Tax=Microbacterium sp. Leaf151 TaxID=1736276 RepID=UPI0006FE8783|nr:helix-turn-helix domain-containing protein [Microbacterium sp. Leaf151]KQR23385.1 hypothetical protein ASF76_09335 [Microbacterium sp. Leaf151]
MYEQGEQIAVSAQRFGVHRTTLDTLITRLRLSRTDPNEVPVAVRSSVVDSYRAGQSLAAIGERFGFSANKVQRLLVATGEPIRSRGPAKPVVTGAQVKEMVAQYERGETIAAIAEAARVSYAQARGCLIDAGVKMRPRGGAK